jgi:hypothetical protein
MGEPQEVEGRWLALATSLATLGRIASELDQARLVGVQFEVETFQARLEGGQEAFRFVAVLEAEHEVVDIAHDDHIATRVSTPPCVYPQVEDVVEIDVRKQGAA